MYLFADDTNLAASGDSIIDLEAAVNSDLGNLRKWLIGNKLSLNVAKTELMLIHASGKYVTLAAIEPRFRD